MGLRGIKAHRLSVRHPGLSQQMPEPAPGWRTHSERMWLLYGYDPKWSCAFANEAEYRAGWARHRETLMRECGPGRRPSGWWVCEGPFPYPGFDREKLALYAAGLLRADEILELRRIGLVRDAAPATVTKPATKPGGRPRLDPTHAMTSAERSRKHRERHADARSPR